MSIKIFHFYFKASDAVEKLPSIVDVVAEQIFQVDEERVSKFATLRAIGWEWQLLQTDLNTIQMLAASQSCRLYFDS